MRYISLIFVVVLLSMINGCGASQDVKNAWKYTTRQYRTYLNTPAEVDYDAKGNSEAYEIALGHAVMGVDNQLQGLSRAMENAGRNVDPEWVMGIVERFPWLTGVALVDADGKVISRYPEYDTRTLHVEPLLVEDEKQPLRYLRAFVQDDTDGKQVYIAKPVYVNAKLRGLVVTYFNPQTLLAQANNPGSFMMVTPQTVLWAGDFSSAATPVSSAQWDKILTYDSYGVLGDRSNEFFWIVRYFGNLPIIYAQPVQGVVPQQDVAQPESAAVEESSSALSGESEQVSE